MRYQMAIQRVHELPRELPHGRLFLDDIEEISMILLDAYKPSLAEAPEEAKITYTIGDSRMDSIADLQTLGGSTTKLRISVGDHFSAVVGFNGFLNPVIDLYSLDEQKRWAVYAKIKSIFDHRQLSVKNAITSLPGWLKGLLLALVVLAPSLGGLISRGSRFGFWLSIGYVVLVVLVALLGFVLYRPSRVFLVRSHESSKVSSAAWKVNVRDFVFIVIGGVVTAVVTEIVRHLFK